MQEKINKVKGLFFENNEIDKCQVRLNKENKTAEINND